MSYEPLFSQNLRATAEGLLAGLPPDKIPNCRREDLITSLTRQWLTYEGHATLVTPETQTYCNLICHENGTMDVTGDFVPVRQWFEGCMRDWNFDDNCLEEVLSQLNLGQNAEFNNRQGVAVRLWLDPKERSRNIEPLEARAAPTLPRRSYRKIASDIVTKIFPGPMNPRDFGHLVTSLVRQWATLDGQAMLLDRDFLYQIVITAKPDGGCTVNNSRNPCPVAQGLMAWGMPPFAVDEALRRLNACSTLQFTDTAGQLNRLTVLPPKGILQRELARPRPPSCQFNVGY